MRDLVSKTIKKFPLVVITVLAVASLYAAMSITEVMAAGFVQLVEGTAPAASPSGRARLYADSTSHTVKASLNAGSYNDLLTSATGCTQATSCLLSGGTACTMVGGTVYSGVTDDVRAATGENLDLTGGGTTGSTGHVNISSRDDTVVIQNATKTSSHDFTFYSNQAAGGEFFSTSKARCYFNDDTTSLGPICGSVAAGDATTSVFRFTASLGNLSGSGWSDVWAVWGGGLSQSRMEQTCTCADNGSSLPLGVIDMDGEPDDLASALAGVDIGDGVLVDLDADDPMESYLAVNKETRYRMTRDHRIALVFPNIVPGTGSCDIQSSNVVFVNNDPDGCVWSMDDTTASTISVSANSGGMTSTLTVKTNAGGTNTFAAVTNEWRDGFMLCNTTGLNLDDAMTAIYVDTSDDFWGVTTCTAF